MRNARKPWSTRRALIPVLGLAVFALLALSAQASATTLTIGCSGKGPKEAASEVSEAYCAVAPGQKRTVEGVLRNDHGRPVSGALKVTFSTYIPHGGGSYAVTPQRTVEVHASASGKFKIPVTAPTTETALYIEALGDEAMESSGVTAEVEIKRYVTAVAKKLGHGRVKVTVKGISGPLKIQLEEEGYVPRGGGPKKAKNGVAEFNLGPISGTFGIYVDAGPVAELFYIDAKPFDL